jgi:pimeloyl-ACP methyl ester carboxylesterase
MTSMLCIAAPAALAFALAAGPAVGQDRAAGDLTLEPRTLRAADGTEISAQRGDLIVPENRANPDSPLIRLAFAHLKSTAANPKAPLIYLAGGPGGSSTGFVRSPQALQNWLPVLAVCDVIFLDQRGTGSSEPDLSWVVDEPFPDGFFTSRETAMPFVIAQAREAAAHFRGQGRDLAGYTTLEAAHDIDVVRRAMKFEKVSLMGFSYGTHLALATIKYHGDGLENVILIGTEGLDMTYKLPLNLDTQFRKLAIMVGRDERVAEYVPDLVGLYEKVAAKLEKEPMPVEIRGRDGSPMEVKVGRWGLDMILRMDIGDASDLPVFPRLLYSIDQGDSTILRAFVQKRVPVFASMNAMATITDGASGASPGRMEMIRAQQSRSMFSDVVNFMFPEVAEAFGAPDLGEDFRDPIVTNVRTLFLSGSLDWNTPPYQAEQVRWGFANSMHIVVENAGHEQVIPQPAIREAMLRFLMGEDVSEVNVTLPPLRFVPIDEYDPEVTHWSVPRG